ncbi:type II toxin-antitoxin system RelE/ParE family toxin [Chryseobacterium sp. MMS23-Vi53]|uniref:type II toxin-antitoxin system RelE/ParE family toxin n=1 Tax=Chryseobacterium sp. MMS23-Vi53 TaxID=3386644 RepID=UPI0039EACFF6
MKIIWTDFAIENLKIIFEYYAEKANRKVAHKIRKQILSSTKQLIQNPQSGQIELHLEKLNQQHRYILSTNYKIIYRIDREYIVINDVFDTRQNPIKMIDEKRNKK